MKAESKTYLITALAVTALFLANLGILEVLRHYGGAELPWATDLAAARSFFLSPVFLIPYASAIVLGLAYLYRKNKKKPLPLRQKAVVLGLVLSVLYGCSLTIVFRW